MGKLRLIQGHGQKRGPITVRAKRLEDAERAARVERYLNWALEKDTAEAIRLIAERNRKLNG